VREAVARKLHEEAARGSRGEEIAAARAAVERERSQLAYLERQRAELDVRAPVAGRIEAFDLRPGDLVAPNQPVATLLEPGELWVRVYVPEPSLGRVRPGAPVTVRVDTWPDRRFAGRVAEIRHEAEYLPRNVQTLDQRSDQVFAVRVEVAPAAELRPGMAAFVELDPPAAGAAPAAGTGAGR
jgi:multidrug resistance efflux pump